MALGADTHTIHTRPVFSPNHQPWLLVRIAEGNGVITPEKGQDTRLSRTALWRATEKTNRAVFPRSVTTAFSKGGNKTNQSITTW